MRIPRLVWTLPLLFACSGSSPTAAPPGEQPATPAPTEHRLDPDAERRNKVGRARWIEELHRAAPGLDWRAIERANGLREMARRNQLGRLHGPEAGGASWTEIGSSNQAGRMHCAVIGPDGQTLYAGSSRGGAWRGALDGSSWTPIADNVYGGVYEILPLPGELPGDPDVILTAAGGSVFVSRNQGLVWETPAGLQYVTEVRSLGVLDDAAPTILLAGQRGGGIGGDNHLGIYASTDYGRSFVLRWEGTQDFRGWMWVPRRGPAAQDTLWVLSGGGLRRSTDGGHTFPIVSGFALTSTEGVLTGSEAGSPSLYAAMKEAGQWKLYASHNAGAVFQHTHDINDFWESLCASTRDPYTVIYGGVEGWRSIDGGGSFSRINPWGSYYGDPAHKLHADIPGIHCWPDPADPQGEIWYISTDGGIFESRNGGGAWLNLCLSGLGVSQYYSALTSSSNPDRVAAGSQDQGYQLGTVQPPSGPGPSSPLTQEISGDYAHLTSGDGTHDLVYSVYPGFILIQDGAFNPFIWNASFPAGAPAPWLPFLLADPLDNECFFFGSDVLYRYRRVSTNSWTHSQHSSQDFTAAGGSYISALGVAPTDPQRMYAVTNAGALFVSQDHGVHWTHAQSGAPGSHYLYGQTVAVHPADRDEVAVGGSGYSTAGVIRSTDGGQSWTPITSGLPQTVVYDLTYAPDGSGDLYAGTESGAWHWDRQSSSWENIMANEAPITTYWSVEAVPPDIVRYATYGRGIWDYRIPQPGGYYTYGQGKVNSLGLETELDGSGTATWTANDLALEGILGVPGKPGIVIHSSEPDSKPFMGGTLLLAAPVTRWQNYQWDVFSCVTVPVYVDLQDVGVTRYYQLWYRDPQHLDGYGIGLSNGLKVLFGL